MTGHVRRKFACIAKATGRQSRYRSVLVLLSGIAILSLVVPGTASAADASFLRAGQMLASCENLISPNGRYTLTLGCDGSLTLVEDQWSTLWTSSTGGFPGATLEMQRDGNLVIYSEGHIARWETGTSGNRDAALAVQDDGNVVVIAAGNRPVWATSSNVWASSERYIPPPSDSGGGVGPLGARESAVGDRLDAIYSASEYWDLDPRLIAAIVHHEGGTYLDMRRTGAKSRDFVLAELKKGSVGIAQIKVRTAQRMLREQYGLPGKNYETVALNLIASDALSIHIAASRVIGNNSPLIC